MAKKNKGLDVPATQIAYINHYSSGGSHFSCCKLLGIPAATGHRYLKRNSGFEKRCDIAREEKVKTLEDRLYFVIESSKDPYALMKMLAKMSPHKWGDKDKQPEDKSKIEINLIADGVKWLQQKQEKKRITAQEVKNIDANN